MKGFFSAIQFITILRIGKVEHFDPQGMIPFFPIVGLILGIVVSGFDWIALQLFSRPVASFLDVVVLIVLTGALHIDGLGDTADGLFGHHSREKALSIMKDSRIGAMGLVAIVCMIVVKWCGITGLESQRHLILIIIPALSRGSMLFGIRLLPYGRPGGGTGHPFFSHELNLSAFAGLALPLAIALFLGLRGLWLGLAFVVLTGVVLYYYKKRLGCITGDMLGAMTEGLESFLFLFASASLF